MRRSSALLAATIGVLALVVGCSSSSDWTARFVRYQILQDGTRVAVVASTTGADPREMIAYTNIGDLRPGDTVRVRDVGKSWDRAQWMPSAEVESRAP